ncbi:hypothetical protein EW145_g1230 [Phellinidium pouzarii]|uniref:Non-haem dioxygenase N-terminal domain-containing protein n=1 Tax=Phellinidium pouzarii TaxID=167371 RepID=A0A4S4LH41_9AGAM|nr:hypothetical protein EW145_g1230 [Phellinidium pouzarii]
MPGISLPPFPDDVPTHPLLVVDYELIKNGNVQEIEKLWKAATELGFWYLKNHGVDHEVDQMFEMGVETMDLPLDEKMQFQQGDDGRPHGYKPAGANATDEHGSPDTVEAINVSHDDALAYPAVAHRTYPSTVNARMESTIRPFVRKSFEVNHTVLSIFEKKLGLPAGALLKYHELEDLSGSEARVIKSPPRPGAVTLTESAKEKASLGAHTDFGSLSFLHNRLGGLQVLPPGSPTWQYATHVRWSTVYFTRPKSDAPLRALSDGTAIKEVVERISAEERKRFEPGVTASEWYARRIRNQRIKNRKGPETYRASRGMEHRPDAI